MNRSTHREAFDDFAGEAFDKFDSVEEIILFGSVARGEQGARSDVDIMVKVSDKTQKNDIENLAFRKASKHGVSITPVIKKDYKGTGLEKTIEKEGEFYVRG